MNIHLLDFLIVLTFATTWFTVPLFKPGFKSFLTFNTKEQPSNFLKGYVMFFGVISWLYLIWGGYNLIMFFLSL